MVKKTKKLMAMLVQLSKEFDIIQMKTLYIKKYQPLVLASDVEYHEFVLISSL